MRKFNINTVTAILDPAERRRRLGIIYSLLVKLADERETATTDDTCQDEPVVAADAPADEPEHRKDNSKLEKGKVDHDS